MEFSICLAFSTARPLDPVNPSVDSNDRARRATASSSVPDQLLFEVVRSLRRICAQSRGPIPDLHSLRVREGQEPKLACPLQYPRQIAPSPTDARRGKYDRGRSLGQSRLL